MKIVSRFSEKKCRPPKFDLELGIRTAKKHYLSFMVNRSIVLLGFGIYGTITEKELPVDYGLLMDDFCNIGNQKLILMRCTTTVKFNGHRDIFPLYFTEPVKLRRFQQYVLYLDVCSYQTYNGTKGTEVARQDKVKFSFAHDFDRLSLSTPYKGNFPQLYYLIPEPDVFCENGHKKDKNVIQIGGTFTKFWENKYFTESI